MGILRSDSALNSDIQQFEMYLFKLFHAVIRIVTSLAHANYCGFIFSHSEIIIGSIVVRTYFNVLCDSECNPGAIVNATRPNLLCAQIH